ncbi:hypothetical protein [Actinomadura litoris]|uniref:Uncharacterized protein n=1 Tax=Actinomadura litoris TaxID=2678616 RepID=A0A7K1LAK2_9ACTN|nr:hypothetical protein [Actinomadura litoris]MUN41448.1 hypothetical protein [Actinomadura litoris]
MIRKLLDLSSVTATAIAIGATAGVIAGQVSAILGWAAYRLAGWSARRRYADTRAAERRRWTGLIDNIPGDPLKFVVAVVLTAACLGVIAVRHRRRLVFVAAAVPVAVSLVAAREASRDVDRAAHAEARTYCLTERLPGESSEVCVSRRAEEIREQSWAQAQATSLAILP